MKRLIRSVFLFIPVCLYAQVKTMGPSKIVGPTQTSGTAGSSPAFVQSTNNASGGGTTLAFGSAVSSGDLLIVSCTYNGTLGTSTITDTVGTTYTLQATQTGTNNVLVYSGLAAGSGSNTVTWTVSGVTFTGLNISEFQHVTNTVDTHGSTYNSGSTATISLTTGTANDLIYGFISGNHLANAWSAGSGYTIASQGTGSTASASEYMLNAPSGSNSVTITFTAGGADNSPFAAVAFKP